MKALMMIAILATGCIEAETDTGPTVTMLLTTDRGSVSSDDSDPQLDLAGSSSLSVTLEVDTSSGETDLDTTSFVVTQFSGTLSMPSTNFTEADFTSDGNQEAPTFTGNDPVVVPASAVGKSIAVTLTAKDSRGVSSNLVSFNVSVVDNGP